MGKFNKTGKREMPALNTSSLPDLIFTLLFFFMIVTTMREVTLKVQFTLPVGTELEKLEKKSLVTFIYVGEPTQEYRAKMGTESRIQLNDSYAEVGEVQDFIFQERASMNEGDQAKMTVSLKVDQKTKMGIITDVKNALRKSYALKINYSSTKRGEKLLVNLIYREGRPSNWTPFLFSFFFSLSVYYSPAEADFMSELRLPYMI